MPDEKLFVALNELMDKHGIERAVLIMPKDDGMEMVTSGLTIEDVRQLAHQVATRMPDTRGPLN